VTTRPNQGPRRRPRRRRRRRPRRTPRLGPTTAATAAFSTSRSERSSCHAPCVRPVARGRPSRETFHRVRVSLRYEQTRGVSRRRTRRRHRLLPPRGQRRQRRRPLGVRRTGRGRRRPRAGRRPGPERLPVVDRTGPDGAGQAGDGHRRRDQSSKRPAASARTPTKNPEENHTAKFVFAFAEEQNEEVGVSTSRATSSTRTRCVPAARPTRRSGSSARSKGEPSSVGEGRAAAETAR